MCMHVCERVCVRERESERRCLRLCYVLAGISLLEKLVVVPHPDQTVPPSDLPTVLSAQCISGGPAVSAAAHQVLPLVLREPMLCPQAHVGGVPQDRPVQPTDRSLVAPAGPRVAAAGRAVLTRPHLGRGRMRTDNRDVPACGISEGSPPRGQSAAPGWP